MPWQVIRSSSFQSHAPVLGVLSLFQGDSGPVLQHLVLKRPENRHFLFHFVRPAGKVDETSMEKSGEETNESGNKAKMPSISLGLPSIPAGKRVTKPFSYIKHNTFDFTLGKSSVILPVQSE